MKYFKIPLNSDLSQTSYRAMKSTETNDYIEYNEGFIGESWEELSLDDLVATFDCNPFEVIEEPEETPYEPTEQELIQAEILLNQAKIMAKLNQLGV